VDYAILIKNDLKFCQSAEKKKGKKENALTFAHARAKIKIA
jgi:hypothetical protein